MTTNPDHRDASYYRTEEDLKRIFKEVFTEEIRQLFLICQESTVSFSESHKLEHDFIKVLIEKEKHKVAFYRDIERQVVGWGVIAIVGAFGAWLISHLSVSTT